MYVVGSATKKPFQHVDFGENPNAAVTEFILN